MATPLSIKIGNYSDKGLKEINQDFHGVCVPKDSQLNSKGITLAIADGISSSTLSHIASETAIKSFIEDYYSTSDALSVKKSAQQVIGAINSWLYSLTHQSQYRYDKDKGYVCTFNAVIFKSTQAHIFHIGDSRIYRLRNNQLEQLTEDHRVWISEQEHYLGRALGIDQYVDFDYTSVPILKGDIFILCTDGVYEPFSTEEIVNFFTENPTDLTTLAKHIADSALAKGSHDNLTIQIARVDELPSETSQEVYQQLTQLPFMPALDTRSVIDGYQIIREIHATSRSHVYLAVDQETQQQVVLKTPSTEMREDASYLERFLMEEWIARRINNAHVLKAATQTRERHFIYVAMEYIDGKTLTQWMIDNPKPDIESVRGIVEQIGKGLQSFHRLEMLHQDLRPENILIDKNGTVKIIDFGSAHVAGLMEIDSPLQRIHLLGTAQYTAPEYFLGEVGTVHSDTFALGVITYHMLSGRLPYGVQVAQAKSKAAQNRLSYQSVLDDEREIPAWIDDVLRKSVHIDPYKRYAEISEFLFDLRRPNQAYLSKTKAPLIERNPVLFWKSLSLILVVVVIALSTQLIKRPG